MARRPETRFDGFICDDATMQKLIDADEQIQAAMGGDDLREAIARMNRSIREGDHAAVVAQWDRYDGEAIRRALAQTAEAVREFELYVEGVRVPRAAVQAVDHAPRKARASMLAGVVEAVRAFAELHPRLDQVLETAVVRREEGKVFAEEARERRDALYRERVSWVCSAYQEVRGKYPSGVNGDKAARLEVAVMYSKVTGRKPMHDRSVCNILAAAARIESESGTKTPA